MELTTSYLAAAAPFAFEYIDAPAPISCPLLMSNPPLPSTTPQVPDAAGVVERLLLFLESGHDHIVAEALIALQELLRTYPSLAEVSVGVRRGEEGGKAGELQGGKTWMEQMEHHHCCFGVMLHGCAHAQDGSWARGCL